MSNSKRSDHDKVNNPSADSRAPDPRSAQSDNEAFVEKDGELDDTLRSLHDLIKDAPKDAGGDLTDGPIDMNQKDPLRVSTTDPKASTDFPTLTDVIHDPDDVQRDLFEQLALGDSAKDNKDTTEAPAENVLVKADKASPTPQLNQPDESVAPPTRDYAADAERFAAEHFPQSPDASADTPDDASKIDASNSASADDELADPGIENADTPAPNEPEELPQLAGAAAVAASRAVAARSQEDGIPVVTSAIDPNEHFPDGVFDGPELDDYAGDTLPGGFLPGSVDNRPYEEFGIDELPGEGDTLEEPAATYERATIWDDRGPDSFVNIDEIDEAPAPQQPLVKHSLNANGEPPLDPVIATQIHDALAGLLGKWPDSNIETPAPDTDNLDPSAPRT